MRDEEIIELYLKRSEEAVARTDEKYGRLVLSIIRNIGNSEEDAMECQNDTYLAVWEQIPLTIPRSFSRFICKIAKNLGCRRFRDTHTQKRSNEELILEELAEVLSGASLEEQFSARELGRKINTYLETVDQLTRVSFIYRYYFGDSVKDIARLLHVRENLVSLRLNRMKKGLRVYLIEEGYML